MSDTVLEAVAPGIRRLAVRTPTLPPATHTNTYVIGHGQLWVVDPASPWEDEQQRLQQALDQCIADGESVEAIVLTHHHADHIGGAAALRSHYQVPLFAHPETVPLVAWSTEVDALWEHEEVRMCGGRRIRAHYTPGHAPGHLTFQDLDSNALIAGDLVAGVGTIVIAPHEGDLGLYLDSLAAMQALGPSVLLPAHGDPMPHADAILGFYIAHRHQRTEQIRTALSHRGRSSPAALVPEIYPELPEPAVPLATGQILSHLRWMGLHGIARSTDSEQTWELTPSA